MSEARRLNDLLARHAPAAAACLSEFGASAAFPHGILAQSREAAAAEINASIGQVTDGGGGPLPLDELLSALPGLDPRMSFLYSPQSGQPALRRAWAERQRKRRGAVRAEISEPLVVHGLTQGVSLVADLFTDADTDVIVPEPHWENYDLVFGWRAHARIRTYPAFDGDRWNVAGLAAALAACPGKALVVLNFPQNPTGYTLQADEVAGLVEVIAAHPGPCVVLVDDAYLGMLYEDGLATRSVFWDLVDGVDPERCFCVKVDGTTKELLFFPGRVGFVTYAGPPEVQEALESKLKCIGRATVGSPPGPSQALVLHALQQPTLDASIQARLDLLKQRYLRFRAAVEAYAMPAIRPFPYNSGAFALLGIDPAIPVEPLRRALIAEHGVGLIASPEVNALRVAYCSTAEHDLPEVVRRLAHAVQTWPR